MKKTFLTFFSLFLFFGLSAQIDVFYSNLTNHYNVIESTNSGDWDDATIWSDGVPGDDDIVIIKHSVKLTGVTAKIKFLKVDVGGEFSVDPYLNTHLRVTTIWNTVNGKIYLGTSTDPIDASKTCRITIFHHETDQELYDLQEIGTGIISAGVFHAFGKYKTPFIEIFDNTGPGNNHGYPKDFLPNTNSIFGWKDGDVGDEVVIAGTYFNKTNDIAIDPGLKDEKREIKNISGTGIELKTKLYHPHQVINEPGLPFSTMPYHVANITRNIIIKSASPLSHRRGHIMFMGSVGDVDLNSVAIVDMGRTDKSKPLDHVFVMDNLIECCDDLTEGQSYNCKYDGSSIGPCSNPSGLKLNSYEQEHIDSECNCLTNRYNNICGLIQNSNIGNRPGRYAVHFHKNGTNIKRTVKNCVVNGAIGWGFVNHSSDVDFDENICYDFNGAGFVTEAGNEIGSFTNNFAVGGRGIGEYFDEQIVFEKHKRPVTLGDFGFGGTGFWFQGPALIVHDNIASSCNGTGMFWFSNGAFDPNDGIEKHPGIEVTLVQTVYANSSILSDPNFHPRQWASTYHSTPHYVTSDLPILEFHDFHAYGCLVGLRLRYNNHQANGYYAVGGHEYQPTHAPNYDPNDPGSTLPYWPMEYPDNPDLPGTPLTRGQFSSSPLASYRYNAVSPAFDNINLWNNMTGLRTKYGKSQSFTGLNVINRLAYTDETGTSFPSEYGTDELQFIFNRNQTNLYVSGYSVSTLARLARPSGIIDKIQDGEVTYSNVLREKYAHEIGATRSSSPSICQDLISGNVNIDVGLFETSGKVYIPETLGYKNILFRIKENNSDIQNWAYDNCSLSNGEFICDFTGLVESGKEYKFQFIAACDEVCSREWSNMSIEDYIGLPPTLTKPAVAWRESNANEIGTFTVFPSPVRENNISVFLKGFNGAQSFDVQIGNSACATVISRTIQGEGNSNTNIQLGELPPGVYFIRLFNEELNYMETKRFTIVR